VQEVIHEFGSWVRVTWNRNRKGTPQPTVRRLLCREGSGSNE
jgi:hypothetical protein